MKSKSLLSFEKPKKIRSTKDHNREFMSEARASGTYVPNMSEKDKTKWKAKKIGGDDRRIEIRKSIRGFDPMIDKRNRERGYTRSKENCGAEILMIVRPDSSVVMSANGRMAFGCGQWKELQEAYQEAIQEFIKEDIRQFSPYSRWEDDQ